MKTGDGRDMWAQNEEQTGSQEKVIQFMVKWLENRAVITVGENSKLIKEQKYIFGKAVHRELWKTLTYS